MQKVWFLVLCVLSPQQVDEAVAIDSGTPIRGWRALAWLALLLLSDSAEN